MKQKDKLIIQKIVLIQYSQSKLVCHEKQNNLSIARQRVKSLNKMNSNLDLNNFFIGKQIIKCYISECKADNINFTNFVEWCLKKNSIYNMSNIELQILEKRKDVLIRSLNSREKINILNWFLKDGIKEFGYDFLSSIFNRTRLKFNENQCKIGIHSYFDTGIGIGNYAKYLSQAISNKNKNQMINLPHPKFKGLHLQDNIKDINIFVIGLDQILNIDLFYNKDLLREKYNILVPFWEIEHVNNKYIQKIEIFDEIWAPTKFIHNIFKGMGPKLRVLPVLTDSSKPTQFKRIKRSGKKGYFLNIFDQASGINRKNLLGTIEAFVKYRENYGTDEKLIFKVYSSQSENETINHILKKDVKKLKHFGIHFIEGFIPEKELKTLINGAIAILSLHKSEGLGLSIIEAMSQSKKVIVTNYGGIKDFCREENTYLVDYSLDWEFNSTDLTYPERIQWAIPKTDSAVLQIHAASVDYWNGNQAKEIQAIEDMNKMKAERQTKINKLISRMLVRKQILDEF
jgi:glycosyltransferase involved in cell wall biosynthesis